MKRRYQLPRPVAPIGGVVQSFTFATSTPPAAPLPLPRSQPPVANLAVHGAGTVVQQTYVFPVNQPRVSQRYRVKTGLLSIKGNAPVSAFHDLPVFPISQPDVWRMIQADQARTRQDVTTQIHQGPTRSTDVQSLLALLQPSSEYFRRPAFFPTTLPILGPPAGPAQTDVFKLQDVVPQGHYGYRPAPKLIVRVITAPPPVIPNWIDLPLSPSLAWWKRLDRSAQSTISPLPVSGAVSQQTYLFPLGQPTAHFYVPRATPSAPIRTDGVEPQALFLFYSTQPDRAQWYVDRRAVQNPWTDKQFPAHETPPTPPQTYVFDLSQLAQRRYSEAAIRRTFDFSKQNLEGAVAIIPWHPFKSGDDYERPPIGTYGWVPLAQIFPNPIIIADPAVSTGITWNTEPLVCVTWNGEAWVFVSWNTEPNSGVTWKPS